MTEADKADLQAFLYYIVNVVGMLSGHFGRINPTTPKRTVTLFWEKLTTLSVGHTLLARFLTRRFPGFFKETEPKYPDFLRRMVKKDKFLKSLLGVLDHTLQQAAALQTMQRSKEGLAATLVSHLSKLQEGVDQIGSLSMLSSIFGRFPEGEAGPTKLPIKPIARFAFHDLDQCGDDKLTSDNLHMGSIMSVQYNPTCDRGIITRLHSRTKVTDIESHATVHRQDGPACHDETCFTPLRSLSPQGSNLNRMGAFLSRNTLNACQIFYDVAGRLGILKQLEEGALEFGTIQLVMMKEPYPDQPAESVRRDFMLLTGDDARKLAFAPGFKAIPFNFAAGQKNLREWNIEVPPDPHVVLIDTNEDDDGDDAEPVEPDPQPSVSRRSPVAVGAR